VINAVILPIIAAVIWGFNPAFIQRFGRGVSAIKITLIRAVGALALLIPVNVVIGFRGDFNFQALLLTIASAVIGPAIGDAAYAKAIQIVGGSLAIVVGYTYIFVAQAIAVALLGESLDLFMVAGAVLAFLGIVVATYSKGGEGPRLRGIAYGILASVMWGLGSVILKPATAFIHPLTLTTLRFVVVALIMAIASTLLDGSSSGGRPRDLAMLALTSGLLSWGVGATLFVYSISLVGVSATVIPTALAPVLAQITTKLVAKDRVTIRNVAGAVMVSAGIALAAL
jgi:DME family drug/metabolite transporter